MDKQQEMLEKIGLVEDPSRNKTLAETNAIKHFGVNPETETVMLLVEVGKKINEMTSGITRNIAKIVKAEYGFKSLVIEYEQARPENFTKKAKIIAIASGKGGVGKSSVTANLAYAFTTLGKKVGIMDADIYGANMPKILGIETLELMGNADGKVFPYVVDGIEMVSTEFFVEENKALMWRGPMLGKVLKIFFEDTLWSQDLDYMFIDLPPGTGDVMLDVNNYVPDAKIVLVTTPHPSASHIAIKAGFAAKDLKQEVVGVIENMSFYEVGEEKHFIFGEGGGKTVADKLLVPLLSQIPIGQPEHGPSIYKDTEYIGIMYLNLARKLMKLLP
ncbi:MAG: P-loop NTPase [Candidatus Izemoplasmatales bacterium]|nr:P-loop NTPase [Candidatus Izemoplasmatales bacterium]